LIYTLVNDYSFEAALTDLTKSIDRIKNANEPRIAGIIYTSSYFTPSNQYPNTGEPSQAPIHPNITLEMNEFQPGLT